MAFSLPHFIAATRLLWFYTQSHYFVARKKCFVGSKKYLFEVIIAFSFLPTLWFNFHGEKETFLWKPQKYLSPPKLKQQSQAILKVLNSFVYSLLEKFFSIFCRTLGRHYNKLWYSTFVLYHISSKNVYNIDYRMMASHSTKHPGV